VSFGILGTEERSDGKEARAMGKAELFKYLAEENIKTFRARGVKKNITLSPHGFNALKNDYPQFSGQYPVFHYSQILAPLVKKAIFAQDLPPVPRFWPWPVLSVRSCLPMPSRSRTWRANLRSKRSVRSLMSGWFDVSEFL